LSIDLDDLSKRILALFDKPGKRLRWTDVTNALFPDYEPTYKKSGERGFGSQVGRKLKALVKEGRLKHDKKDKVYWKPNVIVPLEEKKVGKKAVPREHVPQIVSGVRALRWEGRYRVDEDKRDGTYAKREFMEAALQHMIAGFPKIYRHVREMGICKQKLKDDEENEEYCERYRNALDDFLRETEELISMLNAKIEKLETSYCALCQALREEKLSFGQRREVKRHLALLWE
jgi:hypothetical protein